MKLLSAFLLASFATSASAHESFMPHTHPHGGSLLLDANVVGVAALIIGLAAIAFLKFRQR
ncbi:MAG TPA: hypothetical protein VFB45_08800 [Pseudolabrys sp.]|nr:hypothetical protein [Pseudolabrys sp.]